jgi:hypothetical protein
VLPIKRICPLLLIVALTIALATPAGARESRRTRVIPGYVALPVRLAPGFRPTATSRALRVIVTQAGCGPRYDHAELVWSAHRLTITLLARPVGPVSQRTQVACPDYIAIVPVKIPLGRVLGARAIYDGGFAPPRLVVGAAT